MNEELRAESRGGLLSDQCGPTSASTRGELAYSKKLFLSL